MTAPLWGKSDIILIFLVEDEGRQEGVVGAKD